jgi:molybdopterin-guanine dinucleotide biosynthesis protein A
MSYDGIVLAGGVGRRLGGLDKPTLTIGDRRLLDIAIGALGAARSIVVVGPKLATAPTRQPVHWTREDPAGGGPVAALAAALPLVTACTVVVLAADLPFITASSVAQLVSARGDATAALAIDDHGRDQTLVACYETAALREAIPKQASGTSMRSLLQHLPAHASVRRVALGGDPPPTLDCDTPADLERAKELA